MTNCCSPSRNHSEPTFYNQNPGENPAFLHSSASGSNMIRISGGTFHMGNPRGDGYQEDGEGPVHEVSVAPFWIDPAAVTNARFAAFVDATGYKTDAERGGWSFVFWQFLPQDLRATPGPAGASWWRQITGANWQHPEGPQSSIDNRMDHPVIHVSWNDAQAYCAWTGLRLPTEAEWEFAARGSRKGDAFPWGAELEPSGEHRMNVWQGNFPELNTQADGYAGTAPVTAYVPNAYGLYNMTGNVWEWCGDWFSPTTYQTTPRVDPTGPEHEHAKVIRGGSYLCHASYCNRYRVDSRSFNTPDSSTGNLGFRCARSDTGQD